MKNLLLLTFIIAFMQPLSAQKIKRPDGGSMPGAAIEKIVNKLIDTAGVTEPSRSRQKKPQNSTDLLVMIGAGIVN